MIRTLPEGVERDEQELPLPVLLCRTLQASLGYTAPEVQGVYDRAHELGRRLGDRREISQILYMLCPVPLLESQYRHAAAEELRARVIDLKAEVMERVREIFEDRHAAVSAPPM